MLEEWYLDLTIYNNSFINSTMCRQYYFVFALLLNLVKGMTSLQYDIKFLSF